MSNCGLSTGCLPKSMRLVPSRLTAAIPKATKDNARKQIRNGAELIKPKSEALKEIGIKQDTAERYERLARVADISRRCLPKA